MGTPNQAFTPWNERDIIPDRRSHEQKRYGNHKSDNNISPFNSKMMIKVDPITIFNANHKFIELNRTFRELSENDDENDGVYTGRTFRTGERIGWPNLIKEFRLIILSEAGSGKTAEIRNIAQKLREQNKPAFFLRLEHIPTDFEDAFEVGTYKAFEEWLATNHEGWLFLDSIDEARLRSPKDFELAIHKLGRKIGIAFGQAHIVITGRTTAWRPKTDLDICTTRLPYTKGDILAHNPEIESSGSNRTAQFKTETRGESQQIFKILALDDLTRDQVATFTQARGIENSKAFLDAVERSDAWAFTSRPQDLQELTEFWIDKGRIGTYLELMQNSIKRRLDERDQDRAEVRPLSAKRAREGARLLAAATTLVQEPTIRIPDGTENSKGIAVQLVLSDWDEKDQSTLLSRPIFDEAIYGTVRFHHRSVREYLTAEWFAELLRRETSRRTIEGLFFRNHYGLEIVVPALRPILPWLAIFDEKIRERVLKVSPEIIFEGGEPSQLSLEIRRRILHEVCQQMSTSTARYSVRDYAAVQRFANPDLTDDIRVLLQQYKDNEDLTTFLLRMVWIGQLTDVLPEAINVALAPTARHYTRIVAFRAIKAIGSDEDQQRVRQSFLAEASELNREWLAELLEGVQPSEQTWAWLLACLEKIESEERHSVTHLTNNVTEFVSIADLELLPQLVTGLNRLLNLPPVIEHRYCEVSEKFQWLINPVSKAVERLILAGHPASLEPDTLSVLHKISSLRGYGSNELTEVKTEFFELVPAWKELNRALFWFEVHSSRDVVDKKRGEQVTNFWEVSIFGSFWQFRESDFACVAEEISRQTFLDDKLVALSLAFHLYISAKRPRVWRMQLKKLVAGNSELSVRLNAYLRPPAKSKDSRRWKQQEAKIKKRQEIYQRKQESYHAGWKKYFIDNLDKDRSTLRDNPGTLTNSLLYLYEQTQDKNSRVRWTEYNWKTLIPEYGEDVALFFRDSAVSFWRYHEPQLHSEGVPFNKTSYAVIMGLTGLEIEANEAKEWPKNLNIAEVERACRYASFELNGFPTWFPKLFQVYPKIVGDFLMQEVRYELSIEKPDRETHYILDDVSWSGQWAWDEIAPTVHELLKKREPKNLTNLDKLLKIIQGSSLPDDLIEELAFKKCRALKKLDHVARWFAVWIGVAPEMAIASLKERIEKIADLNKRTWFAMTFVTHLLGRDGADVIVPRNTFKTPEYLKSLYLLMHKHIRQSEDIHRAGTGVYSPGLRDHAQGARNNLFELLRQIPGKESFLASMEIAKIHPEEASRSWILLHAKTKAEQDGDIEPWLPTDVRDFYNKLDRTPRNHRELAELAILRLEDLKDDLEDGDSSIAGVLRLVTRETDMRKYIGYELRGKAFGRYSVPQEEELADAKKPDIRFHGMSFDGPVPVELKLADKWTGSALFERLENQLCGDYLRDNRSRIGIFVLVYLGGRSGWDVPGSNTRIDFAGLTTALENHWQQISPRFPQVDDIKVIGIDLTRRFN